MHISIGWLTVDGQVSTGMSLGASIILDAHPRVLFVGGHDDISVKCACARNYYLEVNLELAVFFTGYDN